VTGALVPLLAGDNWGTSVSGRGLQSRRGHGRELQPERGRPDFFKSTGIRLIAGREFTRADTLGAPKVAIVNEAFARKFNLGANPSQAHGAVGAANAAKLDIEIVALRRTRSTAK
jgi:hypothetical protein